MRVSGPDRAAIDHLGGFLGLGEHLGILFDFVVGEAKLLGAQRAGGEEVGVARRFGDGEIRAH